MWMLFEIAYWFVELLDAVRLIEHDTHEGLHLFVGNLGRRACEGIINKVVGGEVVGEELPEEFCSSLKEDESYRRNLLYLAYGGVLLYKGNGLMDEIVGNESVGIAFSEVLVPYIFYLLWETCHFQRMTVDIAPCGWGCR